MAERERAVHCLECPVCHATGSLRVIDSCKTRVGVRRRRECECCGVRMTSYEVIEPPVPVGVRASLKRATV